MTEVYKKIAGNKKLLVPVVALLLCATAMVGAGYAFLASTAKDTGTLDGDVITVKIGNEENNNWGIFTAKATIDYGYDNDGNNERFYVENESYIIGNGTLEIDVSDYKAGTHIKIAKALTDNIVRVQGDTYNTLNNVIDDIELNFGDDLIFDGNFAVVPISKATDGILSFDFNITVTFKVDKQNMTTHDEETGAIKTIEVNFLDGEVLKSDLATGFEYTVLFSVFPTDTPADPPADP